MARRRAHNSGHCFPISGVFTMSQIRLIVRDAEREITGLPHGSFADAVLAALGAEPETIAELDTALERFIKPGEWSNFRGFSRGPDDEQPFDAGVIAIDR